MPVGLPEFSNPHWDSPTNFVDGIAKNKEYEVKLPGTNFAAYDYYIWETSRTAQGGMKPSDYTLLGEIKKGSKESISIVPTTNNVVIGVRKTGENLEDWSPKGRPTELEFKKNKGGKRGISYYGNKTLVGGNVITNGREIDWTNKKWRQAGSNNFITQTKNGHLVTNKQYIFKLGRRAPKYVYSLWSVDAKAKVALRTIQDILVYT